MTTTNCALRGPVHDLLALNDNKPLVIGSSPDEKWRLVLVPGMSTTAKGEQKMTRASVHLQIHSVNIVEESIWMDRGQMLSALVSKEGFLQTDGRDANITLLTALNALLCAMHVLVMRGTDAFPDQG